MNSKCMIVALVVLLGCVAQTHAAFSLADLTKQFDAAQGCLTKKPEVCTGDCALVGQACLTKDQAGLMNKAFADGSVNLKELGKDIDAAVNAIEKDFSKIKGITGKDATSLLAGLAKKAEEGQKMNKAAATDLMTKLKAADGWGAMKDWTPKNFAESGPLLEGLTKDDVKAIGKETFEAAMETFGKIKTWGMEQAKSLVDKFKETRPDFAKVTFVELNKIEGMLQGVDADDLKKITKETFEASMETFGKITKWGKKQAKSLVDKFKETRPDFANVTFVELNKIEGMLQGVDSGDLKKLTKDAFKGAETAFKIGLNKVGAFDAEQVKAIWGQTKQAYGEAKKYTKDMMAKLGPLAGTLPVDELKELTDDALKGLTDKAAKLVGGVKAAAAWTVTDFEKLTDGARKAFNGADLKALADASIDKVKAVLGCQDAKTCKTQAVADITVFHDRVAKSGTQLMADIKKALEGTKGAADAKLTIVQDGWEAATAESRRRRLSTSTTGDFQSVIRIEGGNLEDVTVQADAAAAATGGSKTVVDLSSGPGSTPATENKERVAAASNMHPTVAVCAAMLAVAAAVVA